MNNQWTGKRFKRKIKINNEVRIYNYFIVGRMANGRYKIQMSYNNTPHTMYFTTYYFMRVLYNSRIKELGRY